MVNLIKHVKRKNYRVGWKNTHNVQGLQKW